MSRLGRLNVIPIQENGQQASGGITPKKAYICPELTIYGSVERMTQNANRIGKTDNARMTRKT